MGKGKINHKNLEKKEIYESFDIKDERNNGNKDDKKSKNKSNSVDGNKGKSI